MSQRGEVVDGRSWPQLDERKKQLLASHIEQYALIGDTHTAALVANESADDVPCPPA